VQPWLVPVMLKPILASESCAAMFQSGHLETS
jgi:hypothetical protein